MRKKMFVASLLLLFFVLPFTCHADQITLLSDEWCPYNCVPDSLAPGYMIEIAGSVFKKAGHDVIYKKMAWSKAVEAVRKGTASAVVGAYKEDVPDFVFPENHLGTAAFHFFTKKESAWKYAGITSLKGVKVGVIDEYAYETAFDGYVKQNKGKAVVQVASGKNPLEQNIEKLMNGEIDVLIANKAVFGNFFIANELVELFNEFRDAGAVAPADDVYIAFSPTHPKSKEYAAILSNGVQDLRKTGELKKILLKYSVDDWK